MTIAVDFDGTIVEHHYPEIGPEIPFAVDTLKMLIKDRHKTWHDLIKEEVQNATLTPYEELHPKRKWWQRF